MGTNVIDITRPKMGEPVSLVCECQKDAPIPRPYVPVVIRDPKGPIIINLVCPGCSDCLSVVDGIVQETDYDEAG